MMQVGTNTVSVKIYEKIHTIIEVSTNLCEVSQWLEKTLNRAFFLLKAPTFTMKQLLRHNAKLTFKHGK